MRNVDISIDLAIWNSFINKEKIWVSALADIVSQQREYSTKKNVDNRND